MENRVATIGGGPEAAFAQAAPPPAVEADSRLRHAQTEAQADLRLIIEEDAASGSYIYKTVDRRTGEIVQQLPRDEILRMHEDGEYSAGGVISARA